MSRICGNSGYVLADSSDILTLTSWEGTQNNNVQTFGDREGAGWQKTCIGTKAFTGTLSGKVDDQDHINSLLNTDNLVALELHHNAADYYSGNARISELSFSASNDDGAPQEWTASFESDGPWTFTSA